MFRHHLAALAVVGALTLPFAASAQLVPAHGAAGPGASAPAAGANAGHGHHRRSAYMRIMRGLNLSDAQKQQIAGIMKNSRSTNRNVDPQTRQANAKAMRQQIEGVLTDAQRTQLRSKLAQVRSHAKPNGPGAPAHPQ